MEKMVREWIFGSKASSSTTQAPAAGGAAISPVDSAGSPLCELYLV